VPTVDIDPSTGLPFESGEKAKLSAKLVDLDYLFNLFTSNSEATGTDISNYFFALKYPVIFYSTDAGKSFTRY